MSLITVVFDLPSKIKLSLEVFKSVQMTMKKIKWQGSIIWSKGEVTQNNVISMAFNYHVKVRQILYFTKLPFKS